MTSKIISTFGGVEPISTHAWSADGKNLAISHNNKQVKVYKQSTKPGKWEATATLDQHDLRVTITVHMRCCPPTQTVRP